MLSNTPVSRKEKIGNMYLNPLKFPGCMILPLANGCTCRVNW